MDDIIRESKERESTAWKAVKKRINPREGKG